MSFLYKVELNGAGFTAIRADLTMLAIFAIGLSIAGYGIFRFTERRARRTGALGRY